MNINNIILHIKEDFHEKLKRSFINPIIEVFTINLFSHKKKKKVKPTIPCVAYKF